MAATTVDPTSVPVTEEPEFSPPSDSTPHAEHEAPADDDLTLADLSNNPPADSEGTSEPAAVPTESDPTPQPQESVAAESLEKRTTTEAKPSSTAKSASAKPNGSSVKKILSAGTFGGVGKAAPVKPTTSTTTAKPAAAPLKKSTSAPPTKPTMSSTKPAATAAPARRASLAPTKPTAPPISKPTLSSSSSSKPTTASSTATARGAVTSPVGNGKPAAAVAPSRPRASVSEGVKRAPLASRQSLASSASKPSVAAPSKTATSRTTVTKPATGTRTSASITSIKEAQEDTKALEELQTKLREATESLAAKTEAATELESQIETLKASLASALTDVETKQSVTAELTEAKAASEQQLAEATEALAKFKSDHEDGASQLQAIQDDLAAAKTATVTQKELIETLQSQIQTLEAEVTASKESLESFRAANSNADEAAVAAAVEHEALIKAQADFSQISVEIEALKTAHAQALEEVQAKVEAAEGRAALAESLEAQLAALRAEKEEAVAKLSEFEVEVLELKESQETAEEERAKTAAQIATLEQQLSEALVAAQKANDDALAKEGEYTSQADATKASHTTELATLSEAHAAATSQLEALKAELEAAVAAHSAAGEEHARALGEAEEGHSRKQAELTEEMKRIATELEGQEAQYNAKVDAVKVEHAQLLQEAFERAKAEASDLHQQDLQALRATGTSTIDQVRAAHEAALADLQADHASIIESTVGDLEKQISKLNLELRATQDDLIKAKTNLELARSEVENLTTQRDEARAALAGAPDVSPQHAEEVSRLSSELAVTKDDLQAVSEMLDLTKASLQEMSHNHTVELEEAAKGRAEEVTKIRARHKSELLFKLSDLEGELATLKAAMAADAAPKSNGNGAAAPPQSPGISKEELQRMHEAHNLRLGDMQAEHEKALKALREELAMSESKVGELTAEVDRKSMEIKYLEDDQEENQTKIERQVSISQHSVLQEDLDAAKAESSA
ncbi:hypothetical protein FB45DRAFT_867140 [Roridomyces roridus]|uniref:TATA element modulatory factor 1 TATA binding domain-containing protein n=1 Tax=Roridomyces roridus TaxID=1738132 RepID=A0AAD7BUH8_9AGAR|nr:hypothetical protein FB45DRAFT_867140 [Roridomyces roridus]